MSGSQALLKEIESLIIYRGRLRLLQNIFNSAHSGGAKTWTQCLDAALDTLNTRERYVILLRYGLNGRPMTYQEIGDNFNLTRNRIMQIEAKAIRKMKHPARKMVLLGMSWQIAAQESKQMSKDMKAKMNGESARDTTLIDELPLPTRLINALLRKEWQTLGDLRKNVATIENVKGIGRKGKWLIVDLLK